MTEKQDIYTRTANQVVSHLAAGERPWVRPWNAEHAAGRMASDQRSESANLMLEVRARLKERKIEKGITCAPPLIFPNTC